MSKPLPSPFLAPRTVLHGGDYYPEQNRDRPGLAAEDLRLMAQAGVNTFSVGMFAWSALEPEEGRWEFGWLDDALGRLEQAGHRYFLATPSGARPMWMARKYPEVRKIDRTGRREPPRTRHNHCWTSPLYRERVAAINQELARRYGHRPGLLGWHISNELGGDRDSACYCDTCVVRWHAWLHERYGTLAELNARWSTTFWSHTYSAWEQIDSRDDCIEALALDWKRFTTDQAVSFYRWEREALISGGARGPFTTNFMRLYPVLDYQRFAAEVDFVADDQYPAYDPDAPDLVGAAAATAFKNDLYRNLKPGVPWILLECCPDFPQWKPPMKLKRPGVHRAEMLAAIGQGAEGTLYFQWRKGRGGVEKFHGAVVDHVGHEHTRVFRTVADLSRLYTRLPPLLGSRVEARVALLYDWDTRWALQVSSGFLMDPERDYDPIAFAHHRPLAVRGVSVDVRGSSQDFSGYSLVIAPMLHVVTPELGERLRAYVAAGGVLVTTPWTGIVDETLRCHLGGWPGAGLRELFGVWNEETDNLRPEEKRRITLRPEAPGGHVGTVDGRTYCAQLRPEGAEVLATYDEDFYAGTPAMTVNRWGRGRAYYLGALFDRITLQAIFDDLRKNLEIAPDFPVDWPDGVLVQRRVSDAGTWLFWQNFSVRPQEIDLGLNRLRDLETDEIQSGRWTVAPLASGVAQWLGA